MWEGSGEVQWVHYIWLEYVGSRGEEDLDDSSVEVGSGLWHTLLTQPRLTDLFM